MLPLPWTRGDSLSTLNDSIMQNIVLSEQDHFIIDNPTQCLAMVGKNFFCKIPIKVRAGAFRACFCSQKHDFMEEGLSREEMFKRMYMLKQVGDEVTVLEGLMSSESFSLHKLLCAQLIDHMKRYKTLQAKYGSNHKMVRRMSSVIEMMEKQVRLWKMINKNRDEIFTELKTFTGSAFSSTITSPANSGTSTPCSANNGPRPRIAKRASSSSFGEPVAKRTAPVSNNTMDVDDDPYVLDGLRSLVTTPLPRSPAITPQPRSPIASPSYNMDSAAAAAKWKATKEAMYAALDEDEAAEEDGADDVLSDEEWSEDEEATSEDQEFIDDDDDDLISWRSNASRSGLSDEMANL